MCRVLIVSGMNEKNTETNWQFIQEMAGKMVKGNTDGIGYTALDVKGNMFGERWHNVDDAFDRRPKDSKREEFLEKYKEFLRLPYSLTEKKSAYNTFGTLTNEIKAITLHTRMATSGKEFANTHPFVDEAADTSLIHNGVISNVTKEDNIRSTCDSERILNMYLKHKVNSNPDNIQSMVDDLKGNFACGIITRDEQGARVIDVFKSRASLHAAWVKEIGLVITTKKEDLESVCKDMNLTIVEDIFEVAEDKHMRLDFDTANVKFIKGYKDSANSYSYGEYGSYDNFQRRSLPGTSTATVPSANKETKEEATQGGDVATRLNLEMAITDGWDYDGLNMVWKRLA